MAVKARKHIQGFETLDKDWKVLETEQVCTVEEDSWCLSCCCSCRSCLDEDVGRRAIHIALVVTFSCGAILLVSAGRRKKVSTKSQ